MRISKIKIKNVKSFKDDITFPFDKNFNICIGPNGGGKSNLLDIIIILIRYFFLRTYKIDEQHNENLGHFQGISQSAVFNPIENYFEKYIGDNSDSHIEITFIVGGSDIKNIQVIKDNKASFERTLKDRYRGNKPVDNFNFIDHWDLKILANDQELSFMIKNCTLDNDNSNLARNIYLQYLNYLDLFILLAKDMPDIELSPTCLYFSPYREMKKKNLQVSLSQGNFYDLISAYSNSSSKTSSSLIDIATYHFANKRRNFELETGNRNYEEMFNNDIEVIFVSNYLKKLGYTWKLECINGPKSTYEIILKKGAEAFHVSQASSGEKEILNFLLGIFAFNIHGGLIIIDEPEVHLHSKWQTVLMDLFIELIKSTNNQFMFSTHSPVFINEKTISNVIRVYKENNNSKAVFIDKGDPMKAKDLLHMINSHNNEKMFFADKVVLVEGISDRLIFSKLIDFFSMHTDKPEIVEVLEVHGKNELAKYRDFLKSISVDNVVIADFDYVLTIGNDDIKNLFATDYRKIEEDVLKDKKSKDGKFLAERIEEAISTNNSDSLKEIWGYIKSRIYKLRDDLKPEEKELLNDFIKNKKESEKIYILRQGEIEDYLSKDSRQLEQIIELVKDNNFKKYLASAESDRVEELCQIVWDILNISSEKRKEFLSSLRV